MRIEQTNLMNISGQKRVETPKRDEALAAPQRNDRIALLLSKPTIDASPDVRMDRVEDARARIASGFYDRPEVREGIAGSFLEAQVA